jgi:hypothetical protein
LYPGKSVCFSYGSNQTDPEKGGFIGRFLVYDVLESIPDLFRSEEPVRTL